MAVCKQIYKRQVVVNEDMVIVMQHKSIMYYDKPYCLGFSIFDIYNFIMYGYFYNVLMQYFGHNENLQLLYSDTDSFILKVKSHNLLDDLKM